MNGTQQRSPAERGVKHFPKKTKSAAIARRAFEFHRDARTQAAVSLRFEIEQETSATKR